MTCGGEIHNAPETNRKLCTRLGLEYMGTAEIVMPENYIALFSTPNSAEEVNHILAAAVPALEQTAAAIESGGPVTEPKPTVFGKFMTYIVNPIFTPPVSMTGRLRWTTAASAAASVPPCAP